MQAPLDVHPDVVLLELIYIGSNLRSCSPAAVNYQPELHITTDGRQRNSTNEP